MWPESAGGKVLAAPVGAPIQAAALIIDAALVHPMRSMDDARRAMTRESWSDMNWENHYMTECAVLPWRLIWSPVSFTSHWLARSIFDVEVITGGPKSGQNLESMISRLKLLNDSLNAGNATRILIDLRKMRRDYKDLALKPGHADIIREFTLKYFRIFMKAVELAGEYDDLTLPSQRWIDFRDPELYDDETNKILSRMRLSANPMTRWAALRIDMLAANTDIQVKATVGRILSEPNPVIRYNALIIIDRFYPPDIVRPISPMLTDLSKNDASGMVRDGAAQILRWLEWSEPPRPPALKTKQ